MRADVAMNGEPSVIRSGVAVMPIDPKTVTVFLDASPSRRIGALPCLQKVLQTLMRFIAAWPEDRARSHRIQSVSGLDHRVLEEIGFTPEQVRYNTLEPVWWR
jgi:hypothetical protein